MEKLLALSAKFEYNWSNKCCLAEPYLKSFPYASSLRRFLRRVNPKTIQEINKVHDYLRLKMFYLPRPRTSLLSDFDSSVLTIYGEYIEEARVGYNPHKKGARSYHPLLCFKFHSKDYWHGLLRPGDAYASAGGPEFLRKDVYEKFSSLVFCFEFPWFGRSVATMKQTAIRALLATSQVFKKRKLEGEC